MGFHCIACNSNRSTSHRMKDAKPGDLVKKKKPSPDLYQLVLKEMNLMPEECLAFEDSRIGLVSAKRANIKTAVNPSQ